MKKRLKINNKISISIVIGLIGIFFLIVLINKIPQKQTSFGGEIPAEILDPNKDFSHLNAFIRVEGNEIMETNDGTKYIIEPKKIRGGGPPKGGIGIDRGIPALDETNIKYVSISEADSWIEDNELVLFLEHNNVKRIYHLQIMVFHEIANDVVAGDPIAITYCPLCGSGIAYFRVINGEVVKLGTSGKLYNSNLVMYDDKTDTYWQQIDGDAIVGELTGMELKELSVDTLVWRDIKNSPNFEGTEVLSQNTGMNRNYGRDPYGNYYEDSFLIFPVEDSDDRIHPKTVIFGIEINGNYKAYQEDDLIELKEINDIVNGVSIKVERSEEGIVKITNLETNEEIVKERDFWFAWYAFHTDTELWEE